MTLKSEQITQKSQSNFLLSFFSLSAEKKEAMTDFYAFARLIDDAVDEHDAKTAERLLTQWREEIVHIYSEKATDPVAKGLQKAVKRFHIPKEYLDGMIDGMYMDLNEHEYQNYQDLENYCYHVAGLVGLVCMHIFEHTEEKAKSIAINLGLALQLTNILRDINEDYHMGRSYIPKSFLQEFAIKDTNLALLYPQENCIALLAKLADLAESFYQKSFQLMRSLPRKDILAAWIMARVYHAVLKKIRHKKYQVFQGKISISRIHKFWILLSEFSKSWIK